MLVQKALNISDGWLELPFLSNFNILMEILLGPTDLLESNEDKIRCKNKTLFLLRKISNNTTIVSSQIYFIINQI